MTEVVVTGLGTILAGCDSPETMWEQLHTGQSQLTLELDPADPSVQMSVGRVRNFHADHILAGAGVPERFFRQCDREVQLYLASVFSALAHAGIDLATCDPERVGLFDGCSRPMFSAWYERLRREFLAPSRARYSRADLLMATPGEAVGIAASLLEARGPVYTFSGTCSSGAIAMGHAFREIQSGMVDVAFATGHESSLIAPMFDMYREAQLISPESVNAHAAVRPYGACLGNAFGEGAVTLVLESRQRAEARGATCYATLAAYGYANNGCHPLNPDGTGGQVARLVRRAVESAGLTLGDIGFVVGHGNAVRVSDASERNYMLLLFGDRVGEVPLLSNKPIYGHTLGASSAVNAAAATLMLQHQYLAPTINVDGDSSPFNHMAGGGEARPLTAGIAVGLGLGGNNTVLLFKRAPMAGA